MTDSGVDWDGVSFIYSSKYRGMVLDELADRPKATSKIAESQDVDMSHVSRALGELRERDVVELLVDEDTRKGRIYALTEKGEEVAEAYSDNFGGATSA